MSRQSRVRRARAAWAGALILLACWLSAASVFAQLGSLVVTITSPAAGAVVSGPTAINASVTIIGAITVAGVQFKVDGVQVGAEDTTAPYSVMWDTTSTGNGHPQLSGRARDN